MVYIAGLIIGLSMGFICDASAYTVDYHVDSTDKRIVIEIVDDCEKLHTSKFTEKQMKQGKALTWIQELIDNSNFCVDK